jgi:predicted enzyme related to lactoylglutathione lyase
MSDEKRNALNWFEIPAADFQRAKKFYESILVAEIHSAKMGDAEMAFLPTDEGKVGGAIVHHPMMKPGADGTMVYLNANPDLNPYLERITKAGGKVIVPKTQVTPEIGFFAVFIDSEGNKVALHSQS